MAVDGISLTCFDVQQGRFAVAVIPWTWEETTLSTKRPGDQVNVEFDILGKYALRALGAAGELPPELQPTRRPSP